MVEIIVEPFDDRVASSPRLLAGSRGSAFERRATCFVPYIYICVSPWKGTFGLLRFGGFLFLDHTKYNPAVC